MEKVINKRKIRTAKTLENRYIRRKYRVGKFVKVTKNNKKTKSIEKSKKDKKIGAVPGAFQLVVINIPWYKKAYRKLMGLLGLYYEF